MSELLVLVGPPGLGDVDEAFLREFVIGRRQLGDPMFALLPAEDST